MFDWLTKKGDVELAMQVLAAVSVGLVIADERGSIQCVNEWVSTWGAREWVGRRYSELHDDENGAEQFYAEALSRGAVTRTTTVKTVEGPKAVRETLVTLHNGELLVLITLIDADNSEQQQRDWYVSHDVLTGALSRSAFEDELNRSAQDPNPSTILLLDIDDFNELNQQFTPHVGDQYLQHIARLLNENTRTGDAVARVGADEFAVLLRGCTVAEAYSIALNLKEILAQPQRLHKHLITKTVSLALSPVFPKLTDSVLYAIATLNAAKKSNEIKVFDQTLQKDTRSRQRLIKHLHTALRKPFDSKNGFTLYAQKITPDQKEVLIRLQRANHILPPALFLPLLDTLKLTPALDFKVIERVIFLLHQHPHLKLSVNVSGLTLNRPHLLTMLDHCTQKHPFNPQHLIFEVTETEAIRTLQAARSVLGDVRARGMRVALDDFGAGYSSFAYLQTLPFDELKIDSLFVKDCLKNIYSEGIVRACITLAHSLNKRVCAEGAETEELVTALKLLNVDSIQGYGVHAPEPISNLLKNP